MSALARIRERGLRLGAAGWPVCFCEGRLGGGDGDAAFGGELLLRFGFTPPSTVARRPPLVRPRWGAGGVGAGGIELSFVAPRGE